MNPLKLIRKVDTPSNIAGTRSFKTNNNLAQPQLVFFPTATGSKHLDQILFHSTSQSQVKDFKIHKYCSQKTQQVLALLEPVCCEIH